MKEKQQDLISRVTKEVSSRSLTPRKGQKYFETWQGHLNKCPVSYGDSFEERHSFGRML